MIIHEVIGNSATLSLEGLMLDLLELEWFESAKRIQRKRTTGGTDVAIRFLKERQRLLHGDVL